MDESTLEQLRRALDDTAGVVAGVGSGQWGAPTPCSQWTVRDVVRHLVAGHRLFARALRQEPASAHGTDELSDQEWPAAYNESAAALLEAFRAPGSLERPVTIPFGTVPADVALHLRLVEALVHGWDVARATGQPQPFDAGIAEQQLAWAEPWLARVPADRSPFAAPLPVAEDAPALDRLVARLGRDAAWATPG